MASMIPYSRYNRLAHTAFPFDDLFDAMTAPVSASVDFKMDVEDAGDGYVVSVFVPGVTRDQIDVELNEGRLVIAIDHKDAEDVDKHNYLVRETCAYHATRGIYLKDADTAGLSASLKDGVLTVNVPKRTQNANVTKVLIG